METTLQHITLQNFKLKSGKILDINLSYQIFWPELFSAPVILVNHALTGNSNVSGEKGWWKDLIGKEKIIDTDRFTVLCFNIPGNGFDGNTIENYQDFTTSDIAKIFLAGLEFLKINNLHALIGGSLGGAIGWEMLAIEPNLTKNFIPVACDYQTSDWLYSQCLVQKFLLNQKEEPLQKARIHAMLCYRTPESLNSRFKNEVLIDKNIRKSEDWLNFHGKSLADRFNLHSYKLMNQLLMSINTDQNSLRLISANIHLVAVDTDLFFPACEMKQTYLFLAEMKHNVFYHTINSIHGHDAFLIEYEQLTEILKNVFNEK